MDLHQPWRVAFPVRYDPLEASITTVYRSPSFLEDSTPVQTWLHQALTPTPEDAEGTLLALCRLVFRTVSYVRRVDQGVQTPAQTLDLRTGSCRDLATLMMEAARLLDAGACLDPCMGRGLPSNAGLAGVRSHPWRGHDDEACRDRREQSSSRRDASDGHLHWRAKGLQGPASDGANRGVVRHRPNTDPGANRVSVTSDAHLRIPTRDPVIYPARRQDGSRPCIPSHWRARSPRPLLFGRRSGPIP
jgi:Transglutaminase-like superfamily